MQLHVRHTTQYRYSEPALRVTQALRLWPTPGSSQGVREWRVDIDGKRLASTATDGFGNPVATHTADGPVNCIRINVSGRVDTRDTQGLVQDAAEPLPPAFFAYPSALTTADDAIRELALKAEPGDGDIARLHRLCNVVRDQLDYIPGQTDVETTAVGALQNGAGVCQDHAHLLIAAAVTLGYPARYVSGYLSAGAEGGDAASHAWAEVFVPDLGWVGFDAANRICPDEHYVRIACGRDYHDAAPVRGVRHGGVAETLEVSVHIRESQSAQ